MSVTPGGGTTPSMTTPGQGAPINALAGTDTRQKRRPARSYRQRIDGWQIIGTFLLALCAISFIAPLFLVISASFTSEASINRYGYGLVPHEFSTAAYEFLLRDPWRLVNAYVISITVTALGTFFSLFATALLAYVLSRRDLKGRRPLTLFVLFPLLFSGGIVPTYILVTQWLDIDNTLLALVLPVAISTFNVMILRTFFGQLPEGILESARIDGAGEFQVFFRFAVPLSAPALITVGMFIVLLYWNDWWLGLLFISDPALEPVQLWLYRVMGNVSAVISRPELLAAGESPPIQSLRMAVAVLAIGPVIFAFFWVQKFFIRGITLGGMRE